MSDSARTRKKRPSVVVAAIDDPQARRIAAARLQRAARWLLAFHPIGQEHRFSAARAAYGVSVGFLQKDRITAKRIPFVRLGDRCLYDIDEALAAVKALTVGGTRPRRGRA